MALTPIVGLGSGEIIQGSPKIVDYTKEILRNPIDSKDTTARSALSLLPDEEQFIIESHLKRNKDLFELSEKVLTNRMSQMGYDVSATENLLRNKFWLEYDHVVTCGFPKLRLDEVIRGVCSFKFFRESFLSNQYLVAFLMLPPVNFKTRQEETLLFALDKMRAILDLPMYRPNGDINLQVVKAQMGVYAIMEKRVQDGGVQKTMNAHAILPMPPSSREELDQISEEQMLIKMQELLDKQKSRNTTKAAISDVFTVTGRKVNESEE